MSNEKQIKNDHCALEPEEDPQPSSPSRSSTPGLSYASSSFGGLSSGPATPASSPVLRSNKELPRGTKRGLGSDEDTDASTSSEEPPAKKQKSEGNEDSRSPTRLKIKRHSPKARVPTRGSALAAGYDLYRLDAGAFIRSGGPGLTDTSAQNRRLSRRGEKRRLIPRFRLEFLLGHMDASPRGVALVGAPNQSASIHRHSDNSPAAKFGIDTGAGVIDADYRGLLYILLFNLSEEDFKGPFPDLRPRRFRLPVFFQSARAIALLS